MKVTARLSYEKVRLDEPRDLHLVVTLEAPRIDWQARRPRVCVIPVVDVSGSMRGPKLHHARQSLKKLVDHLAPGDHCGVVAFSDDVVTLAPPAEMTPARKEALKAAVNELEPLASTNLAGGLLAGLEHANRLQLPQERVRRVVLFTDGLANVGVATKGTDILRLLSANLGSATVSAFGYGTDADQELLRDMAAKGKGNYAFVSGPEDALTAFARELGGLLSTYARDLEIVVRPAPGTELIEVVSDVEASREGGSVRVALPDILSEETRQIVLRLRVGTSRDPGRFPVVLVQGRHHVIDGASGRPREERFEIPLDLERIRPGEEQREPVRDVDEVVALAELVRAQIDAEERARHGAFEEARRILYVLLVSLERRGHRVAAEACSRVLASVADPAAYEDSRAFRQSFRKGATRSATSMIERGAASLLERGGLKMSTPAQETMASSFGRKEEGRRATGPWLRRPPRSVASQREQEGRIVAPGWELEGFMMQHTHS